jgi:HEAT repeat protein
VAGATEKGDVEERVAPPLDAETAKLVEDCLRGFTAADFKERVKCFDALLAVGDPAVPPVVKALQDENRLIRMHAADLLRKWALDPEILPTVRAWAMKPLVTVLGDPDYHVRVVAIQALGSMKDPRAVDPLIESLRRGNSRIRGFAAQALRNVTGEDFGEEVEAWVRWQEGKE